MAGPAPARLLAGECAPDEASAPPSCRCSSGPWCRSAGLQSSASQSSESCCSSARPGNNASSSWHLRSLASWWQEPWSTVSSERSRVCSPVLSTIRACRPGWNGSPTCQTRLEYPWLGRGFGTYTPEDYFLLDNEIQKTAIKSGLIGVAVGPVHRVRLHGRGRPDGPTNSADSSALHSLPRSSESSSAPTRSARSTTRLDGRGLPVHRLGRRVSGGSPPPIVSRARCRTGRARLARSHRRRGSQRSLHDIDAARRQRRGTHRCS